MAAADARRRDAASDPLVRKVLDMFPGSQVVAVHTEASEPMVLVAAVVDADGDEADVAYVDDSLTDDEL